MDYLHPGPININVDISDLPGALPVAVRTVWLPLLAEVDPRGKVGIRYALSVAPGVRWHAQMLEWVREPLYGLLVDAPEDWRERARIWAIAHKDQVVAALVEDIAGVAPALRQHLPEGAE